MLGIIQAGLKPREPRVKVLVPCRIAADGRWADACIHNASSRGLLLAADLPTRRGDYVDIRRGTLVIIGRVMWSKGRFFGIKTQDRISVDSLVAEPRRRTAPGRPVERRTSNRSGARCHATDGRIARRVERNRQVASLFQYGFLALGAVAVAGFGASWVYELLSGSLAPIRHALAGTTASF